MNTIEKEVSSCFEEGKVFPPGFRFHPTDEELVLYYLKRKICRWRHRLDVIGETDVYKWDPEDLPGISKLRTGDRQWFFFSTRDRKYPNGARPNRATRHGYWKATGKDRIIQCNERSVGIKKTLVFYKGRAPKGERTDWVMHEYTMDEEELKRCQSAKDYYVLYKVYKKSGPGPKNGEQYGAPFREEDWVDELDSVNLVESVNNVKQVEAAMPVSDNKVNGQLQSQADDFEEFMNSIAGEPVSVPPLAVDYGFPFNDLVGEEDSRSNLVDETSRGFTLPVLSGMVQPAYQQHNGQASFDIIHSGTSHSVLDEAPEVTSTAKSHLPKSSVIEGDLEEFLEMDDLNSLEFMLQHSDKPTNSLGNLEFDELADGFEEADMYNELSVLLREGEAGDQGLVSQQYMNNLDNRFKDPISDFSNNDFEKGMIHFQQSYLYNGNDDTNVLHWSHDQRFNMYTPGEASQGTIPLASAGIETPSSMVDATFAWLSHPL